MIVIFVLYFSLLWFVWAWYNFLFITDKNFHSVGAILSVMVVLGIVLASKFGIKIYSISDIAYLSFVALTLRWCLFDLTLNLMLKKEWYYIGSGWIDKTFKHWQFYIKLFFLFLSLCICLAYAGIGNY